MNPYLLPTPQGPIAKDEHRLLTRPPRIAGAMIILLSTLIVGLIFLANSTLVPQVIRAPGSIMPEGRFVSIETMEGGIVEAVLARDGDYVEAGDILVQLRNPSIEREITTLTEQIEAARQRLANTGAILAAFDGGAEPAQEDPRRLREQGLHSAAFAIQIYVERLRIQNSTIQQQEATLEQLVDALAFAEARVERQQEITGQQETLFERGLIERSAFIAEIRQLDQLLSAATEAAIRLSEARNTLATAIATRAQERLTLLQDTQIEDETTRQQLAELEAAANSVSARSAELALTAPVDGIVQADVTSHPGAVIAPGELLFELLPERQALVVEIRVPSDEIGQVAEGQQVALSIDTFDVRRFGQAHGTVVTLAPSSITDERTGDVYFRAFVQLESAFIGEATFERRLQAGMTAVAEISSGEQTLLAAFLGPIHRTLSTAFSENI